MRGKKANISPEILTQLVKNYTTKEIAQILNVSETTITRYKNKYQIKTDVEFMRKRNSEAHTKYISDINYFEKIDTYDKAYLLGFICADGFVTNRNEVGIGVAKKDEGVVDFFKKQLNSDKPIVTKENEYLAVELRIQNEKLARDIQALGVIPNKSLILNIEEIIFKAKLSEKQIPLFLLGYFDGDGCISIGHRKDTNKEYFEMNITGTYETISYFKKFFNNHGTITKRHLENNVNNYTLQMSNNYLTIYNALSKLYKNKDKLSFYLERKYILFKKLEDKVLSLQQ